MAVFRLYTASWLIKFKQTRDLLHAAPSCISEYTPLEMSRSRWASFHKHTPQEEKVNCIAYKKGYKYQLQQTYSMPTTIRPTAHIETAFIILDRDGNLTIRSGYAWDGPSGPTIDTSTFMRGSLVHDALYQLMKEHHLDRTMYRRIADRMLRQICLEDGMFLLRAIWVYLGVRYFAGPATRKPNPVMWAPESAGGEA